LAVLAEARLTGRAVAHGCARARRPGDGEAAGRGWELTVTIRQLAVGDCVHQRESAGYQPSPRCGTWSGSGSGPVPSPAAGARRPVATRTTPCPMTRAGGRVNATSPRYAGAITGPNRRRAGGSISQSRASWCGRFPTAAATGSSPPPTREMAPD